MLELVPDGLVTAGVEQHYIMKFIVNEKVKPAEILHRLNSRYGEETLSHVSGRGWFSKFYEGRIEASNLLHSHV
jgi:hypothetical protein